MPQKWNLEKCFEHFGAAKRNPRSSVSARSADGHIVVIALWKDRFTWSKPIEYAYNKHQYPEFSREWIHRPSNRERIENLAWARDYCGGLFKVVIAVAVDTKAVPREIAECYPQDKLMMRLMDLNEDTGEFLAIQA